ncbi:MAG: hypothetical protein ACKVQU_11535 [Burkholderiales bacterium]
MGRPTDGFHLAETGEYLPVILDVMTPGLDGWTVRRALCRSKETPG